MKKNHSKIVLLSLLALAQSALVVADAATEQTEQQARQEAAASLAAAARAEAAAERALLKFTKPGNIELMNMLGLLANREKELTMLANVLKTGREADQLRKQNLSSEDKENALIDLGNKIEPFFAMLAQVPNAKGIVEESLHRSTLVEWREGDERIPLLLQIIKLSKEEQIKRLKEALDEQLLAEVAAVYTSLMVNMPPSLRKVILEKMNAAEKNAEGTK